MTVARLRPVVAGLGILLAVLAIGLGDRLLTWVAIAVLAVALVMRFPGRGRGAG